MFPIPEARAPNSLGRRTPALGFDQAILALPIKRGSSSATIRAQTNRNGRQRSPSTGPGTSTDGILQSGSLQPSSLLDQSKPQSRTVTPAGRRRKTDLNVYGSALFSPRPLCHPIRVQLLSLIPRLLSVLVIVGLLTAPMATPSSGEAMNDASMGVMSEMASMPAGMPCCPDQKPALPDCSKSCPIAVLCLAKCFPGIPAASAVIPARIAVAAVKMPWDDIWRDVLLDPPPPKPPRA